MGVWSGARGEAVHCALPGAQDLLSLLSDVPLLLDLCVLGGSGCLGVTALLLRLLVDRFRRGPRSLSYRLERPKKVATLP